MAKIAFQYTKLSTIVVLFFLQGQIVLSNPTPQVTKQLFSYAVQYNFAWLISRWLLLIIESPEPGLTAGRFAGSSDWSESVGSWCSKYRTQDSYIVVYDRKRNGADNNNGNGIYLSIYLTWISTSFVLNAIYEHQTIGRNVVPTIINATQSLPRPDQIPSDRTDRSLRGHQEKTQV